MHEPEFTALQVTVLIRTQPGTGEPVKEYLNTVSFQYQLQDKLAAEIKQQLNLEGVEFDEVIVSLDMPAERARRARSKSSLMHRLFGSK
jgi:hypothetical protein